MQVRGIGGGGKRRGRAPNAQNTHYTTCERMNDIIKVNEYLHSGASRCLMRICCFVLYSTLPSAIFVFSPLTVKQRSYCFLRFTGKYLVFSFVCLFTIHVVEGNALKHDEDFWEDSTELLTMINNMRDPCSVETERKETPGTHPVCIHAIISNMGRLAVGPSFTMPCAHTTTCSVAALWRCRRRGWTSGRDSLWMGAA